MNSNSGAGGVEDQSSDTNQCRITCSKSDEMEIDEPARVSHGDSNGHEMVNFSDNNYRRKVNLRSEELKILRNGDSNGEGMVRVFEHSNGRIPRRSHELTIDDVNQSIISISSSNVQKRSMREKQGQATSQDQGGTPTRPKESPTRPTESRTGSKPGTSEEKSPVIHGSDFVHKHHVKTTQQNVNRKRPCDPILPKSWANKSTNKVKGKLGSIKRTERPPKKIIFHKLHINLGYKIDDKNKNKYISEEIRKYMNKKVKTEVTAAVAEVDQKPLLRSILSSSSKNKDTANDTSTIATRLNLRKRHVNFNIDFNKSLKIKKEPSACDPKSKPKSISTTNGSSISGKAKPGIAAATGNVLDSNLESAGRIIETPSPHTSDDDDIIFLYQQNGNSSSRFEPTGARVSSRIDIPSQLQSPCPESSLSSESENYEAKLQVIINGNLVNNCSAIVFEEPSDDDAQPPQSPIELDRNIRNELNLNMDEESSSDDSDDGLNWMLWNDDATLEDIQVLIKNDMSTLDNNGSEQEPNNIIAIPQRPPAKVIFQNSSTGQIQQIEDMSDSDSEDEPTATLMLVS